jgi:hypothetical protein
MCRNLGSPEVAIAGAKSSDRSRVVPESSLSFRRTATPTKNLPSILSAFRTTAGSLIGDPGPTNGANLTAMTA